MITPMTLQQVAAATSGVLCGEDTRFSAVSTDTRKIQKNDLFVAVAI